MKTYLRLIGPLIFILIFYFYVDLNELKQIFSVLRWHFFYISLGLIPPLIFLRSSRWRRTLIDYDISYSRWQCFQVYFVEMVAVMVIAVVGTFSKAVYLKRDGYGLLRPMLTIIIDKYYDYLLPLIFGVASVFIVWSGFSPGFGLMAFVSITGLAFIPARNACLLISTRVLPNRLKKLFLKKGWNLKDHISKIHANLNFRTYLYSVGAFGLSFISIYYLTKGLNLELHFFQVVLVLTITSLIAFIPISFFGIGTRDAGLLVVFNWFGYTAEQAVALSLALLLLRIAIVLMGTIFWVIDPPPLDELKQLK